MATIAYPPWSWQGTAACKGAPPQVFDANSNTAFDKPYLDTVYKAYCSKCPLYTQCLNWAIAAHEDGIWAATDAKERRSTEKALRRANQLPKLPENYSSQGYFVMLRAAALKREKRLRTQPIESEPLEYGV